MLLRSCSSRLLPTLTRLPRWHRTLATVADITPVELDYTEYIPQNGNKTDRPLVIMHGLFGSKRNWSSLCKVFLKDLQRPVYALDLRNHGSSTHSPEMTYTHMAADVLNFFKEHSLTNVSLLGHSMGGKVAMTVALEPSLPPSQVTDLIVADIAPSIGSLSKEFLSYVDAMQEIEEARVKSRKQASHILHKVESDPSICAFLLTNLVIPSASPEEPEPVGKFRVPVNIIRESISNLGSFPYLPGETAWTGRTLFVKGEKSKYINDRNLPTARDLFPNSKLVRLNAGHWVHSERPTEFVKAVNDFIR